MSWLNFVVAVDKSNRASFDWNCNEEWSQSCRKGEKNIYRNPCYSFVVLSSSSCLRVLLSNWTGRRQASLQFSQLLPCKLRQAPQASVSFRAALSCMGIKSAWFPGVDTCSQLRGCVCLARSCSSMRYFADAVDVTPPTWPHDQSRRTATFALLCAAHRDALCSPLHSSHFTERKRA